MKRLLFILMSAVLLLSACADRSTVSPKPSAEPIGNPTPEQILKSDPNADIFLSGGIVYRNAENIEWVQERKLGPLQVVSEITSIYEGSGPFEDNMSTKFPPGTQIYSDSPTSHGVLVVKVDGKEIRYHPLIEG